MELVTNNITKIMVIKLIRLVCVSICSLAATSKSNPSYGYLYHLILPF